MIWIVFAMLIIVVWIIYAKRKASVTLSNEQAQIASQLIHKEKEALANKIQDMYDNEALLGKTISLDHIGKEIADLPDAVKQKIAMYKLEMFEKYGPTIPVSTAHRILWELEGNGQMWSDSPGCFERHLQRREGNLLFPLERRIVIRKELEEARENDRVEQQQFGEKVNTFIVKMTALGQSVTPVQVSDMLKEIQAILEEAAAIGGNIGLYVRTLEDTEEKLMQTLNEVVQDIEEPLKEIYSLSVGLRSPYIAQNKRKDSPILKEEQLPTLLSEDLKTIASEGYTSRAFAPNYRPNETDVRTHLEKAVCQGFSKERAARIIAAWNER